MCNIAVLLQLYYIMLCYVMLCYVMLCYVMLCYVIIIVLYCNVIYLASACLLNETIRINSLVPNNDGIWMVAGVNVE